MLMAGGVAALAAAGGGLALLATLTLIGWITAPHVGLGGGLAGALRSAGLLWLVAHPRRGDGPWRRQDRPPAARPRPATRRAGPKRAGRWMTREGHVAGLLEVVPAAMSIALPYALFHRRGRRGEQDLGRGAFACGSRS